MSREYRGSGARTSRREPRATRADATRRPPRRDTSETRSQSTEPPRRLGKRDDLREHEADRMADWLRRRTAGETGARPTLSASSSGPGPRVDPGVETYLDRTMGSGPRLPSSLGQKLGSRLGHSFDGVRVHADTAADRAARTLQARAFAVDSDLYFAAGQYQPASAAGRQLLTHELSHVVQHRRTSPRSPTVIRRVPEETRDSVDEVDVQSKTETQSTTKTPVIAVFHPMRPWIVTVWGSTSPETVSLELYGAELPTFVEPHAARTRTVDWMAAYEIRPELLTSAYRRRFHDLMHERLETDLRRVKNILFETRIDAADEAKLIGHVRWWAERRDLVTEQGRTYFDAFLGRLKRDTWHRELGPLSWGSTSYLDTLYDEVEERAGELNSLIAKHSVEFGGYRPPRLQFEESGLPKTDEPSLGVNKDFVKQTANIVLDRLVGYTSDDDSKIITDALSGLPPREQAAVIKNIMSRYDESDWTGVFGRHGEAWEGGMLYHLFEDLEESDRKALAKSLKETRVLDEVFVDGLVAGRGWVASVLPYTTRKGQEAATYWADVTVESSGAKSVGAGAMGGLASLWLPETAGQTVMALGGLQAFPQAMTSIGRIHPLVEGTIAVGSVGYGSFNTTIAIQEIVTDKNVWTGKSLESGERLARVLSLAGDAILTTTGGVSRQSVGRGATTGPTSRRLLPPKKSGGEPRRTTARKMDPDEVAELHRTHVRVDVEGLPPGQELYVPRDSPAASLSGESTALVPSGGAGMVRRPLNTWMKVTPSPSSTTRRLPGGAPKSLPPGDRFGSYLSNQSLNRIEQLYGAAARHATANAKTYQDLRNIGDSLGNYKTQYLGTVGENLAADVATNQGGLVVRAHGRSNEPGPDVPAVVGRGASSRILLKEVKLGSSPTPYRIGESGFPVARGDAMQVHNYIWSVIRNRNLPVALRARFKLALDEGNIEWQLDALGNVRVKVRGSDRFPGDITVNTPVTLPLK